MLCWHWRWEECFAEHSGEYVRLIGIDPKVRQRIDLLKIGVEKSELDVLLGIEKHDWTKIKQVVVEVHDIDCRVKKVIDLLKDNGLVEITVEKEPILNGADISIVYALQCKDKCKSYF